MLLHALVAHSVVRLLAVALTSTPAVLLGPPVPQIAISYIPLVGTT